MSRPAIIGLCGGTDAQRVATSAAIRERFGFIQACILDGQIKAVASAPGYVLTVRGNEDDESVRAVDGYIVGIESDEAGVPECIEPDMIVYWDGTPDIISEHVGLMFGLLAPGLTIGEDERGNPVVAIAAVPVHSEAE